MNYQFVELCVYMNNLVVQNSLSINKSEKYCGKKIMHNKSMYWNWWHNIVFLKSKTLRVHENETY